MVTEEGNEAKTIVVANIMVNGSLLCVHHQTIGQEEDHHRLQVMEANLARIHLEVDHGPTLANLARSSLTMEVNLARNLMEEVDGLLAVQVIGVVAHMTTTMMMMRGTVVLPRIVHAPTFLHQPNLLDHHHDKENGVVEVGHHAN